MPGVQDLLGVLGGNNSNPEAMTNAQMQSNLDIARQLLDPDKRITRPVGPAPYEAIHFTQGIADILRAIGGRGLQNSVFDQQRRGGASEISHLPGNAPTTRPNSAPTDQGATTNIAPSGNAPASVRHNNPGAMYPGPSARRFGSTGHSIIGGGHQIATFPDAESGAAAQFDLLNTRYAGMPLAAAIAKWSGNNSTPEYVRSVAQTTGIRPDEMLSFELLRSPRGIALAQAMARHEGGRDYPLTPEQWQNAHNRVFNSQGTTQPNSPASDSQLGPPPPPRIAQAPSAQPVAPSSATDATTVAQGPQPPPGGPPAGPHQQMLAAMQGQINDPRIPVERRLEIAKQYMALMAPQPQIFDQHVGDITTRQSYYFNPSTGRNEPIPMGPANQARPPQTTEFGLRSFPQSNQPEDLAQWNLERGALNDLLKAQTSTVTNAIQQGQNANQQIELLNTLVAASRTGGSNIHRGPGSDLHIKAAQFLSNFGFGPADRLAALPYAELITKLNAQLSAQAVNAISSTGSNFQLQSFMQNSPGLMQSQAGMEMLSDILLQEQRHRVELGKRASELEPGQVRQWNRIVNEFYRDNPIIVTQPAHRDAQGQQVPARRITTRQINTPQEAQRLPAGTWFVGPDGELMQNRGRN